MAFEEDNKNVGKNIRLYRIKAGLDIKELSKRMLRLHNIICKPGSLRNYEKGTEKVPAVALSSIAAITHTDIKEFFENAHPSVLLSNQNIHLLEAFSMIRQQSAKDALLHMARMLINKK